MAQGYRVEKVAALIRRELSQLLMSGLKDQRISNNLVSITKVDLSGDLQHCKIFVSVYGESLLQEEIFDGLKAATGFIRSELSQRLQMRRTPELIFELDKGLEQATSVLKLLDQLENERKVRAEDSSNSDDN